MTGTLRWQVIVFTHRPQLHNLQSLQPARPCKAAAQAEPLIHTPRGPCLWAQTASASHSSSVREFNWRRWFKKITRTRSSRVAWRCSWQHHTQGWCATHCQTGETGIGRAGDCWMGRPRVCGVGWGRHTPTSGPSCMSSPKGTEASVSIGVTPNSLQDREMLPPSASSKPQPSGLKVSGRLQ